MSGESCDIRKVYLNKAQRRLYLIQPSTYVGIFSRGVGKTRLMQNLRSREVAVNVPGGLSVFYNATYVGAQQRTVAGTIAGWKSHGWVEGVHWVKNIEPPKHFKRNPDYEPLTWKNTISIYNGHTFIIGSNDRPGLVNSLSITGGIFVDECRFIDEPRMREDLYPAIRGNNRWGQNNPFVFSRTYTSDMPYISDECEWLFNFAKEQNDEQIALIAQCSIKVEAVKNDIVLYKQMYQHAHEYETKAKYFLKLENAKKLLEEKQYYLNKIRCNYKDKRGSTYFDTGSFLVNVNILGANYFFDNCDTKRPLIAKTSFLNIKPEEAEKKFYGNLGKRHFIHGTFDYNYIDQFGIADDDNVLQINSAHIYDYDPTRELDAEFDFGDLCTCTVSQTFRHNDCIEERYLVSLEVMIPEDPDDLAIKINNFFIAHKHKRINIYKDPSGNYQRSRKGQVYGIQLIEKFRALNWQVEDKTPIGSINPSHEAKHQLINMILKENRKGLPIVRIIRETNKQLESSLKKAPLGIKINSDGKKILYKDKSSEKELPIEDKPMNSTDHSDHFDCKLWHKYNHLLPEYNLFT